MEFFCIAEKESALGFRLAGIPTREVGSAGAAFEALEEARAGKATGIILVTSRIADMLRGVIDEHISMNPLPLILEIPSKGDFRPRKSSSELLRQIAGM